MTDATPMPLEETTPTNPPVEETITEATPTDPPLEKNTSDSSLEESVAEVTPNV